jgi:hypothetical protein
MSEYLDEVTETLRKHMAVEARRDGGARVYFDPALQPDRDEALRIERAIRDARTLDEDQEVHSEIAGR